MHNLSYVLVYTGENNHICEKNTFPISLCKIFSTNVILKNKAKVKGNFLLPVFISHNYYT